MMATRKAPSATITDTELAQRFLQFAAESATMLRRDAEGMATQFENFVVAARRVVLNELPQTLASLEPALAAIKAWLLPVEHDILRVAQVTGGEDPYTNLLAWWLTASIHPSTAIARQAVFLESLKLDEARALTIAAEPQLRIYTDDGIPDLVLNYPEFTIVVEAKTGTLEHETPQGLPQTIAYPSAVRRLLQIPDAKPIYTVFLTIDRSSAANEEAINISFFDCALAIVRRFRPQDFGDGLGPLFRVWLSHLFHHAAPANTNIPALIQDRPAAPVSEQEAIAALRHLRTITFLCDATLRLNHD